MAQVSPSSQGRFARWLSHSPFFVGALLFHLVLFLMVATYIVWPAPPAPPPSPSLTYVNPPESLPVPVPKDADLSGVIPSGNPLSVVVIITPRGAPFASPVHPADAPKADQIHDRGFSRVLGPEAPLVDPLSRRMPAIRTLIDGNRQDNPQQTLGDVRLVVATFPVYIASYADGDWACNTRLDKEGNIVAGSIPDLVAKINEWSHGKINGRVVPKPLNIGGPELLDKKPPFIFFTGHKDFVLTEAEIANLRDYLQMGGAIWGDNALAGEGSRFDVAFRREMKRVVPDKDKNFQPYALTDDIFTKSYFPISQVPVGMDYYAELPQHLDIDGKLAIIYTPNDYSDILFMRVLPGDKEIYLPPPQAIPADTLYTNVSFWNDRTIFYRNFNLDSALAVHRLGMNIVAYLLVRFDDQLQLGP